MRRTRSSVFVVALVICITLPMYASADDIERRRIVAVKIGTPPKIDGNLDDPIWEKAQPSGGFTQSKPDIGQPMSQLTIVRVLYDDENIYVGFQCYDSEPEKVIGTETRRDYPVWSVNDYIRFVLDTHHDLRTGYYFGTNPVGAQVDARITDNSRYRSSWDAVWDCAATRHSEGWSAEFSIPFRQLRFSPKSKHVWGFNCARTIRRTNEEGYWFFTSTTSDITIISRAGELVGIENIPQGHQLELRPAVVGGVETNYDGKTDVNSVKKPSLDIKYGLTSGLTLDATINTDFAQVEASEEQVNLSRFDISSTEKRPFFLEGVGIFDTPISLFYSRRIGGEDDKEVPILGGLKLTGKMGKQSLGLLSIQTDAVDEIPSTNFSAFRVQRDILRSSSVGLLFLNKALWEGEEDNQTFGVDLRFNPTAEANISGSLARTWTDGLHDKDMAGRINGGWRTEFTRIDVSLMDIQQNFNPEMGFIPRTDIRVGSSRASRTFLIHRGMFRSVLFSGRYQVSQDHLGQLQDRDSRLSAGIELETGDLAEIRFDRSWEYLDEDWEIQKGIIIPAGTYRWNRYSVRMDTDARRWLRIGGSFRNGEYYNGDRQSLLLRGHIRPVPQLLITGDYSWNFVDLPDGDFITSAVNSRYTYSFSPDFFIKLFLQWNDDEETIRGNLLLRYTYQPGSDFYIVYNEYWSENKVQQRSIVAKLVYFLNL